MRNLFSCLFAAIALAAFVLIGDGEPATQPARDGENLIVNGGFETPEAPDRTLPISKDQLTGWTIERGDGDVCSTYWPAKSGKQSLDLNGLTRGIISQTIDTRPGQWYRLTFAYAGNPDEHAADNNRAAEVQWGDKRIAVLHSALGTLEDMKWQDAEYIVQAKADHTQLLFISITDGKYGVALDDVSLVACEPPATTQPATQPTTQSLEK